MVAGPVGHQRELLSGRGSGRPAAVSGVVKGPAGGLAGDGRRHGKLDCSGKAAADGAPVVNTLGSADGGTAVLEVVQTFAVEPAAEGIAAFDDVAKKLRAEVVAIAVGQIRMPPRTRSTAPASSAADRAGDR